MFRHRHTVKQRDKAAFVRLPETDEGAVRAIGLQQPCDADARLGFGKGKAGACRGV